jgi:hypothetical protein
VRHISRTTTRLRAQAIGLTVLGHAVAVLLLVWLERRVPYRVETPQLQFVSIWPDLRDEPQPAPTTKQVTPEARTSQPQSLPLAPPTPNSPQREESAAQQVPPRIDWNAVAKDAAARFAGNPGSQQTFSPPPQPMRKSCKPRQFDAETQAMMAERLPDPPDPDPVGPTPTANCIVVGGYPKCVQKISVRRRRSPLSTDQLEKRVTDKAPAPSIPSPDVCD